MGGLDRCARALRWARLLTSRYEPVDWQTGAWAITAVRVPPMFALTGEGGRHSAVVDPCPSSGMSAATERKLGCRPLPVGSCPKLTPLLTPLGFPPMLGIPEIDPN